jgi:hypothetical protein
VDLGVGHPRRRANHSFDNLVALDASAGVELHDAAKDEAVFAGAQAANICGQLLRQHRYGAVGKVDAGSAQPRLQIEVGRGAHILGHIGDVDL